LQNTNTEQHMNDTEKLRLVRLAYAGVLADTVLQLS
jgi:hypothetical protein